MMIDTPDAEVAVALFLHDRPATTRRVFAAIREARPGRLFLIADGPKDEPGAAERVADTRAAVELVDWPCVVSRHYAAANIGCRRRMVSGIARVFAEVEAAILLEDDCLPAPGCLAWCAGMLQRFRDDERVMMVAACNPLEEWRSADQSFHYARYGSAWCWGAWRRSWARFEDHPSDHRSPASVERLRRMLPEDDEVARHLLALDRVADGAWNAWDVQWEHARLMHGGLTIVPARNMVDNLGLGVGATHTVRSTPIDQVRRSFAAERPIRPPALATADRAYDRCVFEERVGRHSHERLIIWATRLIDRGRAVQALALVKAGLRAKPGDAPLLALERRALSALVRGARPGPPPATAGCADGQGRCGR